VLRRLNYQHPVFSREAVAAQARLPEISGRDRAYFCGAYGRYGFHEDGVVSAESALAAFSHEEQLGQRALHRLA
jgi:predicted NAD/FAD-binding protein